MSRWWGGVGGWSAATAPADPCFHFLAASPLNPDGDVFFPRAITPAGTQVYGISSWPKVQVFTWPALTWVSNYATPSGSGVDVILDDSGNVYHSVNSGSTTTTVYKNGSSLASVTVAANRSGGGLAWADGWLWMTVSTDAGSDAGSLYRIDPSSGTVTTAYSISGGRLTATPYAATDGAVWFRNSANTVVYRHKSGSTTTLSLTATGALVPRAGGVMLLRQTGPNQWVEIDPSMTTTGPTCDPTSGAGATAPASDSFSNPDLTDVCFTDAFLDIYRSP